MIKRIIMMMNTMGKSIMERKGKISMDLRMMRMLIIKKKRKRDLFQS